ncbi:hypothetical protein [Nocardia sp. NPDC050412]|jgi:hypothetical protein|uniref:hypothetical protein n=1 Tax=Nocardia sp. NPDC050412 TaxID=3364320 RepID=UPI003799A348
MSESNDWPGAAEPGDGLGEFAEELKLLAEAVLERVEPVLRRAADGQPDWSSCSWCPVCAAAALVRGEHHDVLAVVAEHGTAIVTVLREALAGVPVDPVMPEDGVPHDHSFAPEKHDDAPDTESTPAEADIRTRQSNSSGRKRSRYIGIPVTIKA